MFQAWEEFLRGKRNRPDVQEYARHLEDNVFTLHDQLHNHCWKHGGYEQFRICDPKPRIIHKASVADRLVHHALIRQLNPIFDNSFIYDSWSCRVGKGTHAAVLRLRQLLKRHDYRQNGAVWTLKCDIRNFFASIDHSILLELIYRRINDVRLRRLVEDVVESFCPGLPLGNLTSQLFTNIYLDKFDHFVQRTFKGASYLRYCDDFIFIYEDGVWLESQISLIREILLSELKLQLHPQKIALRPWHYGVDWLGYVLYPDRIKVRTSTKKRMQKNIDRYAFEFLDGSSNVQEIIPAVFASYQGLLRPANERALSDYYFLLSKCL